MDTNIPGSNPEVVKTKKSIKKKIIFLIVLIIYSLLLLFSGIILGSVGRRAAVNKLNQVTRLSNPNDPMYAGLSGSLAGKIVKIEGSKAYVLSEKGGNGVFNISDSVSVSEIAGGKIVSLGNTRDKVRLNETGTINITGFGNGYTIYSITYLKDTPPVLTPPLNPNETPKPATSSAKPSQQI